MKKVTGFRLSPETVAKLEIIATETGLTKSAIVENLIDSVDKISVDSSIAVEFKKAEVFKDL